MMAWPRANGISPSICRWRSMRSTQQRSQLKEPALAHPRADPTYSKRGGQDQERGPVAVIPIAFDAQGEKKNPSADIERGKKRSRTQACRKKPAVRPCGEQTNESAGQDAGEKVGRGQQGDQSRRIFTAHHKVGEKCPHECDQATQSRPTHRQEA